MARRISEVKLADGCMYKFAELPTSAALVARFRGTLDGDGFDESTVRSLDTMFRTSLRLAGNSPAEIAEAELLIDFEDKEVLKPVMVAMFRREFLAGGEAVDPGPGAGGAGVGEGSP